MDRRGRFGLRQGDGLKVRLRVLGVANDVKPVGDQTRLEQLAVAGRQRGPKLLLVAVGGLVQIDVHEKLDPELGERWRDAIAEGIEACLAAGLRVTGFSSSFSYVFS